MGIRVIWTEDMDATLIALRATKPRTPWEDVAQLVGVSCPTARARAKVLGVPLGRDGCRMDRRVVTLESLRKMREAKLGKPQTPEHVAKRIASIQRNRSAA